MHLPSYADHPGPRQPDRPDAPVLVLLHAFPLSSVMWERLVPLVVADARVVTVDLPGLGRSPRPPAVPSTEAMARAVLDVLDELGVERATIFGLSTGGYVALALAAIAPERVAGLVLGSTTCWVTDPDVPHERRELADELDRSESLDAVRDAHAAGLGPTAKREQPELLDLLAGVVASSDPHGIAWVARAIAARHDTAAVLRDLDRPVLLLFGDEDTETPPDRFAHAMLGMRSGRTRLEVLERTGHLTALEQPARVAAILRDWLADT